MKRSGFTIVELVVVLVVLALVVLFCWRVGSWFVGVKSNPPQPMIVDAPSIPRPPAVTASAKVGRDAVYGVLLGKWELLTGYWDGSFIEMTRGGSIHIGLKGKYSQDFDHKYGRFSINSDVVVVGPENGPLNSYRVEIHSEDEITLTHVSETTYMGFEQLVGRWKRIGERRNEFGPVADAKRQVQRIEQKLAKLESVLEAALTERDELAAKLRSVGVNSPTDMKNNIRGQNLAKNALKLATEINGVEQQLAKTDTALLDAKAIVRRMEREQAGLSEQEMQKLILELRQAEERTDGTPLPVTPLDVDAAVEAALTAMSERAAKKKANGSD